MKLDIEFKNVTVTLTNEKGEKFTQNVGLSGSFYAPKNFLTPDATITIKKDTGKDVRMFTRALSPKKKDEESKGFGHGS
jgi:hypothetical protein